MLRQWRISCCEVRVAGLVQSQVILLWQRRYVWSLFGRTGSWSLQTTIYVFTPSRLSSFVVYQVHGLKLSSVLCPSLSFPHLHLKRHLLYDGLTYRTFGASQSLDGHWGYKHRQTMIRMYLIRSIPDSLLSDRERHDSSNNCSSTCLQQSSTWFIYSLLHLAACWRFPSSMSRRLCVNLPAYEKENEICVARTIPHIYIRTISGKEAKDSHCPYNPKESHDHTSLTRPPQHRTSKPGNTSKKRSRPCRQVFYLETSVHG